ncbi:hypothetical protein NEHOM01_1591 [Nematocida homosporus]|uniref:uncharacterized protein n=1 Tax=Nematocida homosporus TaxID=1912981 RepID=UPI0022202029|nr:uncharacterized protein NEHOM01_1591 [Nematocida homosporus]KAI5186623.1 hypothetical protein NEHOM01_1591 [Nematocida homosporus]
MARLVHFISISLAIIGLSLVAAADDDSSKGDGGEKPDDTAQSTTANPSSEANPKSAADGVSFQPINLYGKINQSKDSDAGLTCTKMNANCKAEYKHSDGKKEVRELDWTNQLHDETSAPGTGPA